MVSRCYRCYRCPGVTVSQYFAVHCKVSRCGPTPAFCPGGQVAGQRPIHLNLEMAALWRMLATLDAQDFAGGASHPALTLLADLLLLWS